MSPGTAGILGGGLQTECPALSGSHLTPSIKVDALLGASQRDAPPVSFYLCTLFIEIMQYSHYSSNAEDPHRTSPLFWPHIPTSHAQASQGLPSESLFSPLPEVHPSVATPSALIQPTMSPYAFDGCGDGLSMSASGSCSTNFIREDRSRSFWGDRLFTVSPPTPTSHLPPPLVFQHALVQGQLNELETVSYSQPYEASYRDTLTPGNQRIYEDCRGNRHSYSSFVLDSLLTLQYIYGELAIPVSDSEGKKMYKCGICAHPSTTQPKRDPTETQRRWDLSPHVLSHTLTPIKPWFCDCGKSYIRSHDMKRHTKDCETAQALNRKQNKSSMPQVAASGSSESVFNPRVDASPSVHGITRETLPAPCASVSDLDRPHVVNSWMPGPFASMRPPVYPFNPEPAFYSEKSVVSEKSIPSREKVSITRPMDARELPSKNWVLKDVDWYGLSKPLTQQKIIVAASSLILSGVVCYLYSGLSG
ncbi:hypothetical protein PIIN_04962 [Serendipita indica DSM 11827]|uniref:Uncharacterized protein n=1 Tax=Serendipita indica (strain DSM 11827) TaxID=1109443 RepID=G4TI88_SERID|nr:hypothetical protein PIIN_04962 [Serendipita indica DSM 11827]